MYESMAMNKYDCSHNDVQPQKNHLFLRFDLLMTCNKMTNKFSTITKNPEIFFIIGGVTLMYWVLFSQWTNQRMSEHHGQK
jgi:hypothetical protein